MKFTILFIISLISLTLVGQNKNIKYIEINKDKILKSEKISELIPNLPSDCKIISCEISLTSINGLTSYSAGGEKIDVLIKKQIESKNFTGKMFIENIKLNCKANIGKSYQFKVINE